MDAKKLAAWGVASTLVTSHIPSNITYTMAETTKEMNRQSVRKENTSLEIPTNIDSYPFVLQTETRLARVETKVDSVEERLNELSENLRYFSHDIRTLALEFRTLLKEEMGTVRTDLNILKEKVNSLERKADRVETTIKTAIKTAIAIISFIALMAGGIYAYITKVGFENVVKAIKLLAPHH